MPGIAGATLTAMSFIVLYSISFGAEIAPGIVVRPHDHAPSFLLVFAFLIPAVYLDVMKKQPTLVRGALTGLLWAAIFYGFSSSFFEPEFQYTITSTFIAVFASLIGGLIAGMLITRYTGTLRPIH